MGRKVGRKKRIRKERKEEKRKEGKEGSKGDEEGRYMTVVMVEQACMHACRKEGRKGRQ